MKQIIIRRNLRHWWGAYCVMCTGASGICVKPPGQWDKVRTWAIEHMRECRHG